MNGPDAKLVPLSHCLAILTARTKHLYHAYSTNKKHLPHIIPAFTLFTAFNSVITLFPIGQSPTKPGGGGATPTLKTHNASYSTPIHMRNEAEPNQSKPNEKENRHKRKNKGLKPRRGSLDLYFPFMGLQPLKPCLTTLTANEWSKR